MDQKAVTKAKDRLRSAEDQLKRAAAAQTRDEFTDAWYLFLVSAKNIFTALEQGAKVDATSRQWFGNQNARRKADELMQYLYQARDNDEHGLGEIAKHHQGYNGIMWPESGSGSAFMTTDENGQISSWGGVDADGTPLQLISVPTSFELLPVSSRGSTYAVPTRHLGQPIADKAPIAVGLLGLEWLKLMVADAATHVTV